MKKKRKYPLDKDLKILENLSLVSNIQMYPFINFFLRMTLCKSDKNVKVTKYMSPGYNDTKLSTLLIEPRNCKEKLPCIVFSHGGGIVLRALKAHYQFAKWYAEKARCRVVLTDYRMMPKYCYPYATEDCYCTYDWIINNASALNIDKNKIIVSGDSAGGYISAAIFFMAKDRNQILPAGVLMSYPILDRRMKTESMKKYTDTPILNSKLVKIFLDEYLKNAVIDKVEYVSPMEALSLSDFPKTYLEVAEYDCLHDDGINFAERLKKEGVSVELHEIKGSCHGFEVALKSSIVKESIERRIEFIKKIFKDTNAL